MYKATTIKVPQELRDRLATYARRDHVTLAAVIARALDDADERAFWAAVTTEHAGLFDTERASLVSDATAADDLNDDADDAISARDGW